MATKRQNQRASDLRKARITSKQDKAKRVAANAPHGNAPSLEQMAQVILSEYAGDKISAVKYVRQYTDWGLKEAVEFVDDARSGEATRFCAEVDEAATITNGELLARTATPLVKTGDERREDFDQFRAKLDGQPLYDAEGNLLGTFNRFGGVDWRLS